MEYRNPVPTVDIMIEIQGGGVVLIERESEPHGWALPGGYVDYGETLESAALREAREETCLEVKLIRQFHAYSDPNRDARQHNISIVFIARVAGIPKAASDARNIGIFKKQDLPEPLVFDHRDILKDYFSARWEKESS